eukprot:COSAG04_NODE_3740_length_2568_cov_2.346699_3_plen_129_part_01
MFRACSGCCQASRPGDAEDPERRPKRTRGSSSRRPRPGLIAEPSPPELQQAPPLRPEQEPTPPQEPAQNAAPPAPTSSSAAVAAPTDVAIQLPPAGEAAEAAEEQPRVAEQEPAAGAAPAAAAVALGGY